MPTGTRKRRMRMEIKNRKFTLPNGRGFEAELGTKISGEMRLAMVKDFIEVQRDPRLKTNPGYLYMILLTRVVKKIGTERAINTSVIGKLSPEDFSFLIDFFNEINHGLIKRIPLECSCGEKFIREIYLPGEV